MERILFDCLGAPFRAGRPLFWVLLCAAIFLSPPAAGSQQIDTETLRKAVLAAEWAEGVQLDNYRLVDQDGVEFELYDYFKDDRPLVIGFIYTRCPHICPTITGALKKAVDEARKELGDSFDVLTIGFDTDHDTVESIRNYGLRFTDDFKRFRFAVGDRETIEKLTKQLGFFHRRKDDGSFDHIDMVSIVKPDGQVYRQVYSIRTQGYKLKERLSEIISGQIPEEGPPSLIDQIKYFCYRYDPYSDSYVIDWPVFIGFFVQFVVIMIIIVAVWGGRFVAFIKRLAGGGKSAPS